MNPGDDLVGAGRAARAPVLPLRIEHEVVDDQLPATLEHVEQTHGAVRAVEHVVLLDLDHGEVAALGVERVALLGHVLLFGEQCGPSGEPLVSGGDAGRVMVAPLGRGARRPHR